jgi:hypothetical protein
VIEDRLVTDATDACTRTAKVIDASPSALSRPSLCAGARPPNGKTV